MSTVTVPQTFASALELHQAGRLGEAEALYRRILAVQPNHAEARHHLGIIAHQAGRHDLAVEWIHQAIVLAPNHPTAHFDLGEACRTLGRLAEAVAAYRRALELGPDHPEEILNNLGNVLREQGQLDEAIGAYRRALQLKPDLPETCNNLGNALCERGQPDEAITSYLRALQLRPDYPEAHFNLGNALAGRGQFGDAVAAYHRTLQLRPSVPETYNNLGIALAGMGQLDEAISAYRQALQLKPDHWEAYNNLGTVLARRSQLDEAIAMYRRALQIKPDFTEAHNNLGNVLTRLGQLDEATTAYHRALQLKPDFSEACNNLAGALKDQGQLDQAIATYRRALQLTPEQAVWHSNLIYTLHFHPGFDDGAISEEQHRWNRQFSDPCKGIILPHTNSRNAERRLRIGYVSPNFGDHVVGRNLLPLFRCHDHEQFEILCYSGVVQPHPFTDEFRQRADHWRSTVGVVDEVLAEMIRHDGVDILVDLTQHLAGNRLPMFALQPAPVQVSVAGYPETTGLEAIGYRISDRYLEGDLQSNIKHQTSNITPEQVLLIDSFWCYDPCGMAVEVNALPAQENRRVTFGCLNNFCKVNEPVLRLWARVLGLVKDSRLVILSGVGGHRRWIREILEREGVKADRVVFVELRPRRAYLELYHQLDIVLDPFPYNGHSTSLDALWMGVPVVSLAGEASVARAGYSQLSNLGLPGLVAFSEDDYVGIATQLAHDLPRLAELRATLRPRMEASPLMDAPRFARNIEAAYRTMWQAWCTKQSGHG